MSFSDNLHNSRLEGKKTETRGISDQLAEEIDNLNQYYVELCKLLFTVDNVPPGFPHSIPAAECSPSDGVRLIVVGVCLKEMRWLLGRLKSHEDSRGRAVMGLNDKLANRLGRLRKEIESQKIEETV